MSFAGKVDLTNCDREPIHVPGSIQPHGLLLVVDPDELRVLQFAGDTQRLLGRAPGSLPGASVAELLGEGLAAGLRGGWVKPAPGTAAHPMTFEAAELAPGRRFDVVVRENPAGLLLELEPLSDLGPSHRPQALPLVRAMMLRLQGAARAQDFLQEAADEVRRVTGFDRVMIYRFLGDDSGAVIAEARDPGIGAYLDLHYPAADIPKQARALYVRNWVRLIPDAGYAPLPLQPQISPRTGQPLDMSDCALRSVSPIHLEYLRNMGVVASMSLSIIRGGQLWGLIACHHRTPWHLPPMLRSACELFAQMVSLQLEALEQQAAHAESARMRRVYEQLVQVMTREEDLAEGLIRYRPNLLDYLPSAGVALLIDGRYASTGVVPQEAQVRALAGWLAERAGDGVTALDRLPEAYPPALEFADIASGVLAMSISRAPNAFILWFRPELVKTVTWAGNPNKPTEPGPSGHIAPRSSFAAWQEEVRHRAEPWKPWEIEAAQALHVSLLEVVLRRLDQVAQERSRARAQQDLLMAELDHRVKNTLANIQALVRHTRSGAGSLEGFVHDFDRRIRAMAVAHSLLTTSRWEGADLRALVEEELRPYRGTVGSNTDRASIIGPELRLRPKAALALSLALHELATNAAKYGALSIPGGHVTVSWTVHEEEAALDWVESGGPPVSPPKRRGFGSTVVERGLSYELGGRSTLNFDPAGLRCIVTIPLQQLVDTAGSAAPAPAPADPEPPQASLAGIRVLVVEDGALVAMEVRDALARNGAVPLGPAGTLPAAIHLVVTAAPDAAVLDVDLDGEAVYPVADLLVAQGRPFLFTTGYDAPTVIPERFRAMAVVSKPYTGEEVAEALARVMAKSGRG
ncbi:GAF domain-containing protein [Roseomonas sp. OT10]|uniref:HWE histidine kinase domain-containing protein n=1 Tax=Roseomonas cutis TaxID=2897332 RepID=UPI001E540677|nr:HWE histidine kinase domain-containing protein [Roseomonas sp. OT10]UFN49746.1 GAF domain-containing protein [Roseomonas sp. OT10]